jgi:hypothetical protein
MHGQLHTVFFGIISRGSIVLFCSIQHMEYNLNSMNLHFWNEFLPRMLIFFDLITKLACFEAIPNPNAYFL